MKLKVNGDLVVKNTKILNAQPESEFNKHVLLLNKNKYILAWEKILFLLSWFMQSTLAAL